MNYEHVAMLVVVLIGIVGYGMLAFSERRGNAGWLLVGIALAASFLMAFRDFPN